MATLPIRLVTTLTFREGGHVELHRPCSFHAVPRKGEFIQEFHGAEEDFFGEVDRVIHNLVDDVIEVMLKPDLISKQELHGVVKDLEQDGWSLATPDGWSLTSSPLESNPENPAPS